ncbi:MAG: penicillin-binding protein, partial [candidate division NC10 bacterium]|nr:penicillin-binding protein [candidate division NC10 bacterium]
AAVWIGYDTVMSLGPHETSSHLAAPVWVKFMQKALEGTPIEDFPVPENVIQVPVDHQTGLPTSPDSKNAILEYFIKGTEPTQLQASQKPAASGQ